MRSQEILPQKINQDLSSMPTSTSTGETGSRISGPIKGLMIGSLALLLTLAGNLDAREADQKQAIDINRATAEEIANAMSGVGMKVANRIVTFRKKHGPFPSVAALEEVKGIGKKLIKRNQEHLKVDTSKRRKKK
ncbi:MAG: ComEA family DNA-binding protein [Gammaproteobacteria bacterium]